MFKRCAILIPDGVDAAAGLGVAQAVVAPGGVVALVGWHRPRFWHLGDLWAGVDERVGAAEAALAAGVAVLRGAGFAASGRLQIAEDAPADAVPGDVELVVVPADPVSEAGRVWTERLLDAGRVVVWARGKGPPLGAGAGLHVVVAYVGSDRRALPVVAALRALAGGGERLTLLSVALGEGLGVGAGAWAGLGELMGWQGVVARAGLGVPITGVGAALDAWLQAQGAHLLAVPVPAAGVGRALVLRVLAGLEGGVAVVLVPEPAGAAAAAAVVDAADVVELRGRGVARLDGVDPLGGARALDGRGVSVVVGGAVVGSGLVVEGRLVLPVLPADAGVVGFGPAGGTADRVEVVVRVLRASAGEGGAGERAGGERAGGESATGERAGSEGVTGQRAGSERVTGERAGGGRDGAERVSGRVAVFDAEEPVEPGMFGPVAGEVGRRWWAVRMDGSVPCRALRARWAAWPVEGVIDAGAVLGDGDPDDLPAAARPLRLGRVARYLRAGGVAVDLVLGPSAVGGAASAPVGAWAALSAAERAARIAAVWVAPPASDDADGVMRALTDGVQSTAERVEVELDNGRARRRLLALVEGARGSVHLQTYIFEPDAVGHAVVDALIAAAARGVAVRVLVDALYSFHGALGLRNPALARLEAGGVELRVIRPFGVPSIDDLKRRDHRKIVVVDEAVGWITGRNVGAPYYTGFDEVRLSAESAYRDVPWLDSGAELEGPVVGVLSQAFARHWRAAGGVLTESAEAAAAPAAIKTWLVMHESMRDTRTLDAFRRLIETARERLVVVNTFPLQFELQRALQGALARGVQVRYLVGHVRPLYGPAGTPFRGGAIRSLATEVIFGRLDVLIAAGAEARGFALREVAGWDAALGTVLPHVHAKLLSVDGRAFAVGSANVDISAGYWESEALLIVEDAVETARLDVALDALLAAAVPIDASPSWAATAARRTTISRHWPSLLG